MLYNQVYNLASLLRLIELPCTVQLIIGPKPRNHTFSETSVTNSLSRYQSISRGSGKRPDDSNFTAILRLEDLRVRIFFCISYFFDDHFDEELNNCSCLDTDCAVTFTLRSTQYFLKTIMSLIRC